MSAVFVCTGGPVAWRTSRFECQRCHGIWTMLGRWQEWYGTEWVCTHCGAEVTEEGWRWGSPSAGRANARAARAAFTRWLIAGSPPLRDRGDRCLI